MGDSRAIASLGGTLQELSFDHKPCNDGKQNTLRTKNFRLLKFVQ